MRFTKENITQISQKQRKKLIQKTIKDVKNKIKWLARQGKQAYTIEFYEDYTEDEQEKISNYFIQKGFEAKLINNDSIEIK